MVQRLAILTILCSTIAWCAIVILEMIPVTGVLVRSQGEIDQGWRRTTVGWERLAPRVLAWRGGVGTSSASGPEAPLPEMVPVRRWDFHPAVLALMLVVAPTVAFGLFPGRTAAASNRQSQSLF